MAKGLFGTVCIPHKNHISFKSMAKRFLGQCVLYNSQESHFFKIHGKTVFWDNVNTSQESHFYKIHGKTFFGTV